MKELGKNEELVLGALRNADGAMTAYALLDGLRPEGLKAPPQIYRALEKLTAKGIVHRVESLNAYVACCHSHCTEASVAAFQICDDCGSVDEVSDAMLTQNLSALSEGFEMTSSTIEMHGRCADCKTR